MKPGIGGAISAYHVVVQRMPSLEITECSGSVPCSAVYVRVWGFVSIPVMAGGVFVLVAALMTSLARRGSADTDLGPFPTDEEPIGTDH